MHASVRGAGGRRRGHRDDPGEPARLRRQLGGGGDGRGGLGGRLGGGGGACGSAPGSAGGSDGGYGGRVKNWPDEAVMTMTEH